jgi:hypothetical protein
MVLWSHGAGSSGRSSCPAAAWRFLFPVPGVGDSEDPGGTLASDKSSGTGVRGWPLAGRVSLPQKIIHPRVLRFGYAILP